MSSDLWLIKAGAEKHHIVVTKAQREMSAANTEM